MCELLKLEERILKQQQQQMTVLSASVSSLCSACAMPILTLLSRFNCYSVIWSSTSHRLWLYNGTLRPHLP